MTRADLKTCLYVALVTLAALGAAWGAFLWWTDPGPEPTTTREARP